MGKKTLSIDKARLDALLDEATVDPATSRS
jgi:hypothetical protein